MSIIEDGKFMFHVLLHPFDGFYHVINHRKKTYFLPTLILLLVGIVGVLSYQYTGFILNTFPVHYINSVTIFITTLFPIVLFLISNWSITTLFDGNGSIGDIFIVMSYALVPKLLFDISGILLSNVVTMEEAPLLNAFTMIGTVWFCFLLFCGLCVVHEYTALTNVLTLIATFIAVIIIIFLAMLYFTLIGKVIGFAYSAFSEMTKRW